MGLWDNKRGKSRGSDSYDSVMITLKFQKIFRFDIYRIDAGIILSHK